MKAAYPETPDSPVRPVGPSRLSFVSQERISRWAFWGFRGSLAVLDQGLIAVSNFVISILLARWLVPEQYGSYALAFTVFLFLSFAYQALVLEPQRVFGPSEYADRQREYLGVLLWIHTGLALLIVLALGVSAWAMHLAGRWDGLPGALAGVTVAAPCILLLWLARGAFYVRMAPQHSVQGAAAYSVVVVIALLLIYRFGILSPFSAFVVMGLAAVVSSLVLFVRLRPRLSLGNGMPSRTAVFQEHWKYGRWVLLSSVLSWVTGDIYYPVVSSFSGIAAAGALKALLNFSLPVAQTFSALSIFVLPYASRVTQESGPTGLGALTWRVTWLFAAAGIAYWAIFIPFSRPIMHLLYGGRYTEVLPFIPLVAAASLPWVVAYVPAIALRSLRSSASIFAIYGVSSTVTVLIGLPATRAFGLRGALWSMILSNVVALVVAFALFSHKLKIAVKAKG